MASCAEIRHLLQAYVDEELTSSERVILDEHVVECPACTASLRTHQRTSATLFEAFGPLRLSRDLTRSILENLPEMDLRSDDVAGLNFRAKHPARWRERTVRLVPVGIAVLLVVLAAIIRENWPESRPFDEAIGVVTYGQGLAYRMDTETLERNPAILMSLVSGGDRYETAEGATLMLTLVGPTEVRLNEGTRVVVHDGRRLTVEKGQVLLDVGRGRRLFKVLTPTGDITVFGTVFDVRVDSESTRVVVQRGEVQVEQVAGTIREFSVIKTGEEVNVSNASESMTPRRVNVEKVVEWADDIIPDEEATALFTDKILPGHEAEEVSGTSVFLVRTNDQPVRSIILEWDQNDEAWGSPCGYDVYVYTDRDKSLFRAHITGLELSEPGRSQVELVNTGDRRRGLSHVYLKIAPDYSEGDRETNFNRCRAKLITNAYRADEEAGL